MHKSIKTMSAMIAMIMIVTGCGHSKKTADTKNLAGFFPERFEELNLTRSQEIRILKGQSLYEYINGGAELYHLYNFVEVATSSYETDEREIVLDIYRFETDDDAYGLYSSIKPYGPGNLQLGVEGFSAVNSIDFVKGSYIIRIVGFDESETTKNVIENLAANLDLAIPGSTSKPATFELFPRHNKIPGSEKILAESFMGRIFLTDFYTMDYNLEGDEVTLFISKDSNGEKYVKWLEQVETNDFDTGDMPYDEKQVFLFNNDYYGDVIAGLIQGRLVGVVGYKEGHRKFLSRWLESLKKLDKERI